MVLPVTMLFCGLALVTTSASTVPPPSALVLKLIQEQGGPSLTKSMWRDLEEMNAGRKSLADKLEVDHEQFKSYIAKVRGITCQQTCTVTGGCITTIKDLPGSHLTDLLGKSSFVVGSCLPQSLGGRCVPPVWCSACNTVITCKEP